jgi:hypothetical protein
MLNEPPASLSRDVIRFVQQHIHSVLQLELLLLLRDSGGEWTPTAVAEELRIGVQYAELRLRELHLRGLAVPGASPRSYAYSPCTEQRRLLVDELAARYPTTRHTVITLIFSQAGDRALCLEEALAASASPVGDRDDLRRR